MVIDILHKRTLDLHVFYEELNGLKAVVKLSDRNIAVGKMVVENNKLLITNGKTGNVIEHISNYTRSCFNNFFVLVDVPEDVIFALVMSETVKISPMTLIAFDQFECEVKLVGDACFSIKYNGLDLVSPFFSIREFLKGRMFYSESLKNEVVSKQHHFLSKETIKEYNRIYEKHIQDC